MCQDLECHIRDNIKLLPLKESKKKLKTNIVQSFSLYAYFQLIFTYFVAGYNYSL